ncbi:hypothetical protein GCM10010109_65840 [Actinoplanes campanulatus]|nr:hypothetical protein GCM10010109_65840 [Actinoplanes campanulatus]GID40325.1 hypothetical protein Aca09nite_68310 [Actinoplanes campanulatus]
MIAFRHSVDAWQIDGHSARSEARRMAVEMARRLSCETTKNVMPGRLSTTRPPPAAGRPFVVEDGWAYTAAVSWSPTRPIAATAAHVAAFVCAHLTP